MFLNIANFLLFKFTFITLCKKKKFFLIYSQFLYVFRFEKVTKRELKTIPFNQPPPPKILMTFNFVDRKTPSFPVLIRITFPEH